MKDADAARKERSTFLGLNFANATNIAEATKVSIEVLSGVSLSHDGSPKEKGNRRPSRGGKFPDGLKRHSWSLGPAVTEWWSQTAALQKMSDEL
ncbi:hypothetical protein D3C85_1711370 [compost metagenome]